MRAGHLAKKGTWMPPSKSVIFQPRNGRLTRVREVLEAQTIRLSLLPQ